MSKRFPDLPEATSVSSSDIVPIFSSGATKKTTIANIVALAPSGFTAGGDLSGTTTNQTLDKLKGKNLAADLSSIGATEDGYTLVWNNDTSEWEAAIGGISWPAAGGINAVLQRNGSDEPFFGPLTLDQIAAAYSVGLALTGASIVETSATVVTPGFTASYARTAEAAVLTDTIPTTPQDVIGTPTAFSSTGTFQKTTPNQYVTFTLTANETGGPSKTASVTIYWGQKVYTGNAVPATLNEAFIEALPSSVLGLSAPGSFTATAGATERLYYAAPTRYGTPTFTVGGFEGGFHSAGTISVTNVQGFIEDYDLWESDNLNLGATTVVVS